jgi:hypothetical protein
MLVGVKRAIAVKGRPYFLPMKEEVFNIQTSSSFLLPS